MQPTLIGKIEARPVHELVQVGFVPNPEPTR